MKRRLLSPRQPLSPWRVLVPLGFVFASLLALLLVPPLFERRVEQLRVEIAEVVDPARSAVTELETALALQSSSLFGFLLSGDPAWRREYAAARQAEIAAHGRLARYVPALGTEAQRRVEEVRARSARWHGSNAPLLASSAAQGLGERHREYGALLRSIAELDATLGEAAQRRRSRIAALTHTERLATIVLAGLAAAASTVLIVLGRRLIVLLRRERRLRARLQQEAERLEARVAERTRALQEVNAELQGFAYSVSHDLRAPVRAVQGFAQALVEDSAHRLDADGREHLERVIGAAGRMNRLIDDLLACSRLSREELKLGPVGLAETVAAEVASLQAEREHPVDVSVEPGLPRVLAHGPVLAQAVANLLANAVKFVPTGTEPRVRVRAERRGERVRLWVEDNGIGISPEHRERVWGVFERLHGSDAYAGTGIGLLIVRKAVERMDGQVGIESAPEGGSHFWIELPSAEGR